MSVTAPNGASGSMVDHRGRPRVAVTGLGLKTPAGNDVATFWETVLAGRAQGATGRSGQSRTASWTRRLRSG